MYMMWFDDSKKSQAEKIKEAVAAYRAHFHTPPNVVLVNADEMTEAPGVTVRAASYVRRFNLWVGWEDPMEARRVQS